MKAQTKAAHCSLALHAVLVLCAFAFNQYAGQMQPPTVMDMSILMSGAAAGESEGTAAQTPQAPPAPPVKEKTVAPAAKKQVVKTTPSPKPRPATPRKIEPAPAVEPAQPTFAAPAEQEMKPDAAVADSEQPKQSGEASASSATATAATTANSGKPGANPNASPNASPKGSGGLFTASQLDGPLTMLAKTPPVYPHSAKRRNIEGWIKVKFVVDEQGQVDQVTVLDADPEGVFEQSVLRCIASWRFKPGTIGGMAVKALVEQTITFKLEG